MLRHAKDRGHKTNLECSLTIDDIVIPSVCPVYPHIRLDTEAGPRAPNLPSLDRVDNTRGYTPDNIRVISWQANLDKGSLTITEAKQIVSYLESNLTTAVDPGAPSSSYPLTYAWVENG